MTSSLAGARALLIAGLQAEGVRTATRGQWSAPCVLIEPGDPWSEPVRSPGRLSRWRLTAIAGRADSDGALEQLGELVDAIDAGLRRVDGAQLPTWARPTDQQQLDGPPFASTVATIQLTQF